MPLLEKIFKIRQSHSCIKTEVEASVTSFISIVYIVAVNALILSQTGMDYYAVLIATILITSISSILMGLMVNSPMIIAPGMSDNAFFTYTLVGAFAFTWQQSLTIVFIVGILFYLLIRFNVIDYLLQSISKSLVSSMSVGVGFFLIFLGLKNGEVIISHTETLVTLNDLFKPVPLTTMFTLIIALVLTIMKVKGSYLMAIISGVVMSILLGVTDITSFSYSLTDIKVTPPHFFTLDFSQTFSLKFWIATFSLLVLVIFQNLGTQLSFLGVKNEHKIKHTLSVNAISVALAGIVGSSSTCTSAEGGTGIAVGGKTGLTSVLVGIYILFTIFFIPFINLIPLAVISALLILVGIEIVAVNINNIDVSDIGEYFPSIVMIIMTLLTFNIADGVGFGFVFYLLIKLVKGEFKQITPVMYAMAGLFVLYFIIM